MAVTLAACGDIVVTRALTAEPLGLLRDADLAFGNLEIGFGTLGPPRDSSYALRADPSLITGLSAAGFGLVSIANNHALDFGPAGLLECIDILSRAGINHVGGGNNLAAAVRPRILEVKGLRVGFVAFSALLPASAAAGDQRPGIAPLRVATSYEVPGDMNAEPGLPPIIHTTPDANDVRSLCAAVHQARSQADIVIVLPHWGVARQQRLCEYQPPVARSLIDAGADAVIGCHSHLLEGCEIYKGKPIVYSLSQIYLALDHPVAANMSVETAVVLLHIANKVLTGVTFVPLLLRQAGAQSAGEPRLASGPDAQAILDRIGRQSPGVRLARMADTGAVVLS